MFKFFTKRWVSRREFDEIGSELKSVKLEKYELHGKYLKKWGELLNIIEEKEKTIQRLELKLMDDWEREAAELNCTLGESKEKEQDEEALNLKKPVNIENNA